MHEITIDGLVGDERGIRWDRLLDGVVVDGQGPLRIEMVDLLATIRVDVRADVLIVHHGDGSSTALIIRELLAGPDRWLEAELFEESATDEIRVRVRLHSAGDDAGLPVVGLSAVTFASFVGRS